MTQFPIFKKFTIMDEEKVNDYVRQLGDEIDSLRREKEFLLEELESAFLQACWVDSTTGYDHMCISTWESIQQTLLKYGKIELNKCYRKP